VTERCPDKTATHVVNHMGRRGGFNGGDRFVLPNSSGTTISTPVGGSAHDYGVGLFQIATVGQQAATVIGRLYVGYEVELSGPKTAPTQTSGVIHYSSIAATTGDNFAAAALQSGGTAPMTGITVGSNTVTFPAGIPGNYLLLLSVAGATSATALVASSMTGGVSTLALLSQSAVRDASSQQTSLAGTTTSPAINIIARTVTAAGGTQVYSPSTITGTGTMDLFVIALPASVLTVPELGDDRVADLERKVEQLMGLLSPPTGRSASCMTAEEVEEETKSLKAKGDSASDDLGASVHIPRGLLSQFMSGGRK